MDIMELDSSGQEDPASCLKKTEEELQQVTQELQLLQARRNRLLAKRDKLKDAIQQHKSAKLAERDWEGDSFPWSEALQREQLSVFNISSLRPLQLSTMNATMSKVDCILIMPTGGGKSLCYQLPAVLSQGITLVVSPLISLMEDQLLGLQKVGVPAAMLSASSTREEVNHIHSEMTNASSSLKLLYVTPEKLSKSKRFMAKVQKMHQMGRFARLAIDEVHCCSQWGHDFRPDYKFLGVMRKMFPGTPMLGLTATATSRVMQDLQKILNLPGCLTLKASFNRPNLHYEVRVKPAAQVECVRQLQQLLEEEFREQSGIIYTMTIKDAEELVLKLRDCGLRVAPYHAQLDPALRTKVHTRWTQNKYQAVVATIAFGMGIDKPDVRFIIHHCISKSMENYYQESGRAGRDGQPASCIVFWRFSDLVRQSTMVFTEQTGLENLYSMVNYCLDGVRCRRDMIADHFEERWEKNACEGMCDHCRSPRSPCPLPIDRYAQHLLTILAKAASLDQRLTGQKLIDLLLGKGSPQLRVKEAVVAGLARDVAENVIAFLLVDGFLKEDFHFTPYSTISYIVPGPKAEAGITPSPLVVAGKRRVADDQTSTDQPHSKKEENNTLQDETKSRKTQKRNNKPDKKPGSVKQKNSKYVKSQSNSCNSHGTSKKLEKSSTNGSENECDVLCLESSDSECDDVRPSKKRKLVILDD